MQQHIYYTKYALQFADMQIPELVTVFNHQVGNTGWTGMRAYHDQALTNRHRLRFSLNIRTPPLPSALGNGGFYYLIHPYASFYSFCVRKIIKKHKSD